MTDIQALREDVLEHLRAAPRGDALEEMAAGGLMMLFNKMAPASQRIHGTSDVSMSIQLHEKAPSTRTVHKVLEEFTRAVAAIGHEVRRPASETYQLHKIDYDKAPLYSRVGGNVILLSPQAPVDLWGEDLERPAANAMMSLSGLLPRDESEAPASLDAVMAARPPSRQAVRAVMEAADAARGLTVTLQAPGRDARKTEVDAAVAQSMKEALSKQVTHVEARTVTGVLDGGRLTRRIFYFVREGLPELHGTIAESAVSEVFRHIGDPVTARVLAKTVTTMAGSRGREVFELVSVTPHDHLN